jgi:hypothetical protein
MRPFGTRLPLANSGKGVEILVRDRIYLEFAGLGLDEVERAVKDGG